MNWMETPIQWYCIFPCSRVLFSLLYPIYSSGLPLATCVFHVQLSKHSADKTLARHRDKIPFTIRVWPHAISWLWPSGRPWMFRRRYPPVYAIRAKTVLFPHRSVQPRDLRQCSLFWFGSWALVLGPARPQHRHRDRARGVYRMSISKLSHLHNYLLF